MDLVHLSQGDPRYPAALRRYLGDAAPQRLAVRGNLDLLGCRERTPCRSLAVFCSRECPGRLILQTYDLAQALRQTELTVIGGFHSPLERECLTILLRGPVSVILVLARSLERMRRRAEYEPPLESGRLLLLSPFVDRPRRPTVQTALFRNHVVAALAEIVVVAHAAPHSATEQFCRELLAWGKPLYTLEDPANTHLTALGAKPLVPQEVRNLWSTSCGGG
jgi:predicted Rossmann fold nucleotide-binding protein DprA/Smf involved in DNA uptake